MTNKNWDDRFESGENILFYPQESFVRFLNRFIRKRVGFNDFKDILKPQMPIAGGGY